MEKRYWNLALLASFTMALDGGANAADHNEPNPKLGLDEVVVTAQRREQQQQGVPISISTLAGEKLEAVFAGGDDIKALASTVPGLYVESSNGRIAPRFYLRGLGNVDFDLAASQPVAVIFDDVVQENVLLKSFPLFDVDRVEVIRGPQGTLFGRNTTAGAVKFTTRHPSEVPEGYVKASFGTYGTANLESAVGGALVAGQIAGRLSVLSQNRQDWIDNEFTGEDDAFGGYRENAARAQLLLTPAESFSALLNFHIRYLDGSQSAFLANVFTKGSNKLNDNYRRGHVFYNGGDDNTQRYHGSGGSLNLNWDLGAIELTSITAVEKADGSNTGDIDGGVAGVGPGFIPFDSATVDAGDVKQFTEEIRLSNTKSGPWNWQVGAFYFDSDLDVTTDTGFNIATANHDNKSWALFGHSTFELTPLWELSAGLRYTADKRDFHSAGVAALDTSAYETSWDAGLKYTLSSNAALYARIAQGFHAPSIQGRDVAFGGQPSLADSETIYSYEIGVKSDLFENRLRINAAMFYYTIDGFQLSAIGGASNSNRLLNADKGVGQGIEFDIEAVPTPNIKLTAGFAYNRTEIHDSNLYTAVCGSQQCTPTDPINIDGAAKIDGNPFPGAPETTANLTARYQIPQGDDGLWFVFADWSYQGETNLALYESREFVVDGQFELGMRAGYESARYGYEAAIFGRNITNEDNVKGFVDFNNNTGFVNDPRIVGIEITYKF